MTVIISVSSSYSDGDNFGYRITSNGFEGETKSSWYSLYAEFNKGRRRGTPSLVGRFITLFDKL